MTHPHPVGSVDETSEQRLARRAAQRQHDLAILAAGGETGWWDEHGVPAPWPRDFFDVDTGWRPEGKSPDLASGQQSFLVQGFDSADDGAGKL